MAIRFKCPKCGAELNVKDELAGKQGRCPACKSAVTVPRLAPARRKVEEVVEAEVIEEVEEVDEVEYVDEDELPRRPVGIKRRRDVEEEDDRPRRSRRRDEDEEDEEDEPRSRRRRGRRDEDEEEDERPSRRSASRRRRDEDDYEDDYDEEDVDGDPERRKKARAKKRRKAWRKAGTGVLLTFISMCTYTSAWGVILLVYLIAMVQILSKSLPGGGFFEVLGYLTDALMVLSWVLFVVGGAFLLLSPGRHGEMGLGIATLSVSSIVLLFYLYLRFALEFSPVVVVGGIGGARGGGFNEMRFMIYFWPMLELARLTLFGIYKWATAKTVKDEDLASSSLLLSILLPSVAFGIVLLTYLLSLMVKSQGMAYFFLFFFFLELAGWVALLAWFTLNTSFAKRAIDYAN